MAVMIGPMSASQPAADRDKPAWQAKLAGRVDAWREMPAWRKAVVIAAGAGIAAYLAWKLVVTVVLPDENRPASDRIVAAVETFKAATGKYPEKLAELEPKFFKTLPRPVPDTNFVYAVAPDGKSFWFGYQTARDNLAEYDSRARKWEEVEYEDSYVLRQRAKEFVKGR